MKPTLTVDVRLKGKEIIDASLNPASRLFFEKIASELSPRRDSSANQEGYLGQVEQRHVLTEAEPESSASFVQDDDSRDYETVEVPLVFDSQFFEILHADVNSIDNLQEAEQRKMNQEITELGGELALVTKPSRFHKTDLEPWRYILELYVEAEVFFATREQTHGTRTSQD